MSKVPRFKHKKVRYVLPRPGASPGLVYMDENSLVPTIWLHTYNAQHYETKELRKLSELKKHLNQEGFTFWVEIKGFKSDDLFETLAEDFNINKLVIEDITTTNQRPKFEEFGTYDFATSRMLSLDSEGNLENEQVSFVLTENVLFTFQDRYTERFQAVKKRLDGGKGNIRIAGSSYLMYALMDLIVDKYFGVLSTWNEELDLIEDRLFEKPGKELMFETQKIKRELITLRRIAWPERDKLNDILRSETSLIGSQTKLYFRDAYDHTIQIIDMIESMKEITSSAIDMYLSLISNRMNEIMKVLTIISSIFIPLTFIAGIYGMNFSRQDPVTGEVFPHNMPELYSENGYLYSLIIMAIIAIIQIIYFWKKGWFR